MKNPLFGLVAIVLFSFIANAQDKKFDQNPEFVSGSLITLFNKEKIEYKFKSLDELNDGIDEIIKEFNFNSYEKDKELCELSMEVQIKIAVGIETILLSELIKTSCADESASQAVKRLKMLLSLTSN